MWSSMCLQLARTDGFTPLHEAAAAGHMEAAKALLSVGATADVTNKVSPAAHVVPETVIQVGTKHSCPWLCMLTIFFHAHMGVCSPG